ncbi:MAG: glycosyltransferase [Muribaculaceae bacterium]|nr:glycosyltransferase [Muribaculaceae bacterium]MDE6753220.1 glycosyltransferase [Muribaculaceae bacterium]
MATSNQVMVSVIIPNYNHAPYLKERIDSVLNQTYQDFEVIILDDCSQDNSREIINQYRNHPKVSHIVFNEQNSGSTFKQWQKGFDRAKGEYIWIAESDDVAHPEFLSKIISRLNEDLENVLGFSALVGIDSKGNRIPGYSLSTYSRKNIIEGKDFIKKNMIFGCHILNASSVVFRKSALKNVPDEYMSFKTAGDYLFWIELAKQGNVIKVSETLDYFRQHDKKVTPNAVKSGLQFKEVHKIFLRLKELGILTPVLYQLGVGFWIQRIHQDGSKIESEENRKDVESLWRKSSSINYISRYLYLLNGIGRRIKKKYLGYSV